MLNNIIVQIKNIFRPRIAMAPSADAGTEDKKFVDLLESISCSCVVLFNSNFIAERCGRNAEYVLGAGVNKHAVEIFEGEASACAMHLLRDRDGESRKEIEISSDAPAESRYVNLQFCNIDCRMFSCKISPDKTALALLPICPLLYFTACSEDE